MSHDWAIWESQSVENNQKNISSLQWSCRHERIFNEQEVQLKNRQHPKNNIDKVFFITSAMSHVTNSKTIGRTAHDHEENNLLRGRSDTIMKRNYLTIWKTDMKNGRQTRCELRERRGFSATLCRWSKNVVVAVWREKKDKTLPFSGRVLTGACCLVTSEDL